MPKNEEDNPLYNQLLAIQENAAQIIEQAEEQYSSSIGFLDWEQLQEEDRRKITEWHRSLQNAKKALRSNNE